MLVPALTFLAQIDQEQQGMTWWQTIQAGGLIGYVIIGLSVVALALIIMHLVQIRRNALVPPAQLEEIDRMLARGNVNGICRTGATRLGRTEKL